MSESGADDSDGDEFESTLATAFHDRGAAEEQAASAASKAAAFRGDFEADLTVGEVVAALEAAPYDSFAHRFDWAIGDLADANEGCTDSREYRLSGFGDLAADPTQGA